MGDEIPNDRYTKLCPNLRCSHGNLEWRDYCAICGTKLDAPLPRSVSTAHHNPEEIAMPNVALGHRVALKLCEVLGLDKSITNHISLDVDVSGLVTVTTTRYVTEAESEHLTALFSEYYLVARDSAEDGDVNPDA